MPRGRSTFTKRQKEQARQQKQLEKAERKRQRKQEKQEGSVDDMRELRERVKRLLDYIDKCLRFILDPLTPLRARSLRVAVIVFGVILVIFRAIAFVILFVFFLVWLFSKEHIDNCRAIRGTCVEVFWMYSAHAQWYASHPPGQPR